MDKPQPKHREPVLNFSECQKYIEYKLGYDIRDVLGKFEMKSGRMTSKEVEYWDWWHFLTDRVDIHNPCTITIDHYLLEDGNEWQNKITQAFLDEFGETEYWVEW